MIVEQEKKHICPKCGQAVDPQRDSWRSIAGIGGGIQHVTCPTSPEMRDLPPVSESQATVETPELLTQAEAAALIRVSPKTIQRRIRAGELPAVRLRGGQTVLVKRSDVLGLLEPVPVADFMGEVGA